MCRRFYLEESEVEGSYMLHVLRVWEERQKLAESKADLETLNEQYHREGIFWGK
jgi:hypothetical protein